MVLKTIGLMLLMTVSCITASTSHDEMERLLDLLLKEKRESPLFGHPRPGREAFPRGGKRHLEDMSHQQPLIHIGKREAPPRLGKREAPPRLGKREAPPRLGKREAPPRLGKREAPPRLGKREAPPRVGKRELSPRLGRRAQSPGLSRRDALLDSLYESMKQEVADEMLNKQNLFLHRSKDEQDNYSKRQNSFLHDNVKKQDSFLHDSKIATAAMEIEDLKNLIEELENGQ